MVKLRFLSLKDQNETQLTHIQIISMYESGLVFVFQSQTQFHISIIETCKCS